MVPLVRFGIIFGLVFTVGLIGIAVNESQAQESPEIDQNQGVSEFRSDGVEIVHYQDGSKLYRASMHDGLSTSDDLR